MAKRRTKKSHHRRRRVGALSMSASSPLMKYGPIVLGYIMEKQLNTMLDNLVPVSVKTSNPNYGKMASIAEAGIGAYLVFGKGKKSTMKTILGGLLLGAGANGLIKSLKAGQTWISGYGAVPVVGGYGKVPVIGRKVAGYTPNANLAGYTPNASLNGQRPVHKQVMGAFDEGRSNHGSGYME